MKINKILIIKTIIILSVVFGTVLRILTIITTEFFRDEAFSGILATKNIEQIITVMIKDGNGPLHAIILHFWTMIFGLSTFGLRSFSFFIFILATIYLYKLLQSFRLPFYTKSIIFTLYFLNPALIFYASEGRNYGLIIFFVIALFYYTYKIFIQNNAKIIEKIMYILINIAGLYTHNLFLFIFFTNLLIIFVCFLRKIFNKDFIKFIKKLFLDKNFQFFVISFILIILLYLPWLFVLKSQIVQNASGFWLTFNGIESIIVTFENIFCWPIKINSSNQLLNIIYYIFIFITCLLGLISILKIYFIKKYRFLSAFFFIIFSLYTIFSFKQPILYIRYISYIVPIVIILIGLFISNLSKILKYSFVGFLVIFYFSINLIFGIPKSDDNLIITPIISFLNYDFVPKRDIVVNANAFTYFNFEFYSKENYHSLIYDKFSLTPYYVGKSLIPDKSFISDLSSLNQFDKIYFLSDHELTNEEYNDFIHADTALIQKLPYKTNLFLYIFKFNKSTLSIKL